MTARMRWGALTGSPVPWLAALAGVVLVASLAWLTTDDPLAASLDIPDVEGGAPTTTAPARSFSGVPALLAILIDTPAGGAEVWLEGVAAGLNEERDVTEVPSSIDSAVARRFDVETGDGVQHLVVHLIQRGRRFAAVKLATYGTLDPALAESYARTQADRMATAAP